jgi:hypothetical protein
MNLHHNVFMRGKGLRTNMTAEITKHNLIGRKFRFTSSEMLCFATNLPFMIGKYIDEDDPVWIFLLDFLI